VHDIDEREKRTRIKKSQIVTATYIAHIDNVGFAFLQVHVHLMHLRVRAQNVHLAGRGRIKCYRWTFLGGWLVDSR